MTERTVKRKAHRRKTRKGRVTVKKHKLKVKKRRYKGYVGMNKLREAEDLERWEEEKGFGKRKKMTGDQLSKRLFAIGLVPGGPDVIFMPAAAFAKAKVDTLSYPVTGPNDEKLSIVGKIRGLDIDLKSRSAK